MALTHIAQANSTASDSLAVTVTRGNRLRARRKRLKQSTSIQANRVGVGQETMLGGIQP
jgi:hypothetical protein